MPITQKLIMISIYSKILFVSLEHIEVFLVIFSETSETGHVGFPENWVI